MHTAELHDQAVNLLNNTTTGGGRALLRQRTNLATRATTCVDGITDQDPSITFTKEVSNAAPNTRQSPSLTQMRSINPIHPIIPQQPNPRH